MYVERRAQDENTPEAWANQLANPRRLSSIRRTRLAADPRFALIRRYTDGPLLDVGCGRGEWVAFLNSRGLAAHGLDYSPELIEANRRAYPEYEWLLGSVQEIPAADSSFGGVISWGVIEHDPAGPSAAIGEFHRILRPGGTAVVSVPIDSPRQRVASREQHAEGSIFFQYFFTPDELAEQFSSKGFEVLETTICAWAHPALLWPRLYARCPALRRPMLYPAAVFPRRYGHMLASVARKPA